MLVLSRKVGQRILIGDNIAITVVRVSSGGVRLGIEAPNDLSVVREELKGQLDFADAETRRAAENGQPSADPAKPR